MHDSRFCLEQFQTDIPRDNIKDCSQCLQGKTIFSTLDLTNAYYQIPVAEEDIPRTAITASFGMYEFLNMFFA